MAAVNTKKGSVVFLKLENFAPAWREAVVLNRKDRKLVLAVRVISGELEGQTELSSFTAGGQSFILVEGDNQRVRKECSVTHRPLEVEAKTILEKGAGMLQQESLQFVTASDDVADPARSSMEAEKALLENALESDSEADGESEDLEQEELFKLLSRARRLKQGKASGSDRPRREQTKAKTRYALLNGKKSKSGSPEGLDKILEVAMSSQGKASNLDLSALVQMEILRELRGRQKEKRHAARDERSEESVTSDEASSSSSHHKERLKGAGRALKAFRKGKQEMRRNPLKHVRRYIRDVEENIGANRETPYQLSDYSRKLVWGKQRTLQRVHFAASEILQTLLKGRQEQAALQLTQLLRATHQCCLDQGSWQTAWLLMDMVDPLDRPKFGGEPQDLEVVSSYLRAMQDLEKRSRKGQWQENDETGSGKGKNGKGKKKEEQNQ